MENYGRRAPSWRMAALVTDQSLLPPLQVMEQPRFTCNVTEGAVRGN